MFCVVERAKALRGFSLIEILIALTLVALVATAIGVGVNTMLASGKNKLAQSQAYDIGKSFDLYNLDFGRYPSQSEGFEALVSKNILEKVPVDPWKNEFIYRYPGVKNRGRPDIISKGPDGIEGTPDDIGNWDE